MKYCLPLVLSALMLTACCKTGEFVKPDAIPKPTKRVVKLMGGHPHAKAIMQTGKATAYRIKSTGDPSEEKTIGTGVKLTPPQRQALVRLLARDDAYEWEAATGCMPMPGILITFEDGATYARVRLCFSCKMVGYKPGSWEDFDPINAELIQWAKDVFPDDKLIQSLSVDGGTSGL